jgi:hypothetical protein
MARGFEINQRGLDQFTRELQREFDKRPIRIPVQADQPESTAASPGVTTVYNGPVIFGNADGAQLAWGNQTVTQTSNQAEQIAPGFEVLAQAVVDVLRQLPQAGLSDDDEVLAREASEDILAAITEEAPNVGKVKRVLATLKGVLAPLALAAQSGASAGVAQWAQQTVMHLSSLI